MTNKKFHSVHSTVEQTHPGAEGNTQSEPSFSNKSNRLATRAPKDIGDAV